MARKKIPLGGKLNAVLEVNQELFVLMTAGQRKRLFKHLGNRVGNEWRFKYLKRRLTKRVLSAPWNYKLDTHSPMIGHGRSGHKAGFMANTAIWKGKVRTNTAQVSKSGSNKILIQIGTPYGHPVPREIVKVFKTPLPDDEENFVADRFGVLVVEAMTKTTTVKSKRGKPSIQFSAAQRRAMGMKPIRGKARSGTRRRR